MLEETQKLIDAIDKHLSTVGNPSPGASAHEVDNYLLLASAYNMLSALKLTVVQLDNLNERSKA